MSELADVAPAFVEMAHQIVWCSVATVDPDGRPRSRILHPIWLWEDDDLAGWVATSPTPVKASHLEANPYVSCNYWSTNHDTCAADCHAAWHLDDDTCTWVWDLFKSAPAPVGYDPAIIPPWAGGPTAPEFAVLKLEPYRLRVFPGSVLQSGTGEVLRWSA